MKLEDVKEQCALELAASLDHPSVFMGGPSERNKKRARAAIAIFAPHIAAAEREACASLANQIGIERWHGTPLEDACDEIAAAIRARNNAP